MISKEEIENELKKYPEWFYPFDLDYGINTNPQWVGSTNIENRKRHMFTPLLEKYGGSLKGKRILDVGCNEGYWSFEAIKQGAEYVLGIEGRQEFVDKANFVKKAKGLENIEFKCLTTYDISKDFGKFDIVLFFGILYHLSEPIGTLRQIHSITNECIVVDTDFDYYTPYWHNVLITYREFDPRPGGSKMGAVGEEIVLIPTLTSLYDMLESSGFANARFIEPHGIMPADYLDGRHGTVIAEVSQNDKQNFSTLTPRYYRPQKYYFHNNITLGPPWDVSAGIKPPIAYGGRIWTIQKAGEYTVEFTSKTPVLVDIVLNQDKIIFKQEVNGTYAFRMHLNNRDSIDVRIITNDPNVANNMKQIRIIHEK